MSSCQAELANKAFQVKVVDESGKIIMDEIIHTLRNGFFEIWLPKDRKFMLIVKGMNRKAEGTIGTFEDSKTCITTFRLR